MSVTTYKDLREIVLAYLQQTFNLNDPFPGNVTQSEKAITIDKLILRGANNARKFLEKKNNWVMCEVVADVVVPSKNFVSLTSLVDKDTQKTFDMNTLTAVSNPLTGKQYDLLQERTYNKLSHARSSLFRKRLQVVARNNRIGFEPGQDEDVTVTVHGYKWMEDYFKHTHRKLVITVADVPVPTAPVAVLTFNLGEVPLSLAYEGFIETVNLIQAELLSNNFEFTQENGVFTIFTELTGTLFTTNSNYVFGIEEVFATDWMLQHGFDCLQWATIVEVNHLVQTFVQRQEGSLPPPVTSFESSFIALMEWDSDLKDSQYNICE